MVRFGLAVTLGALLAGTAAQAQNVTVGGHQQVSVTTDTGSSNSQASGNNTKISGQFPTSNPSVNGSGGAYDTFITTTDKTVSFEAANIAVGPHLQSVTSTTAVDLTFKNTGGDVENGILRSTLTAAGLGFYVANIGEGGCLYTNCSSQGASPFSSLTGTADSSQLLGTVSVAFQVYRNGVDGAVFDIGGSLNLYRADNDAGFFVDDSSLVRSLRDFAHLEGFGVSTDPLSNKAFGYAWSDTERDIGFGSIAAGETVTLTYLTTVTSTTSALCAETTDDCLIAFAGFGDPIGRGGGVDGAAEALTAFSFGLNSFTDIGGAGPTLGGLSLASGTPIPGIGFQGATFQLPTFKDGVLTFNTTGATAGAAPEPASWAIMIAGFGLAGAALRRRRHAGANA